MSVEIHFTITQPNDSSEHDKLMLQNPHAPETCLMFVDIATATSTTIKSELINIFGGGILVEQTHQ